MLLSFTNQEAMRWLPVINVGTESIPQFGVMRITGTRLIARQVVFEVRSPTARSESEQDVSQHLINGPVPIPRNETGKATRDWPCQVYVNEVPGVGGLFRIVENSFKLERWNPASLEDEIYHQVPPFQLVSEDPAVASTVLLTAWMVPTGDPTAFARSNSALALDTAHPDTAPIWQVISMAANPDGEFARQVSVGGPSLYGSGIQVYQSGYYLVWFYGTLQFEWDPMETPGSPAEGDGSDHGVPVPPDGGRTIAFWKSRAASEFVAATGQGVPGTSEITGVRVFYRPPAVTIEATPSATAVLDDTGRAVSLIGVVECDVDDILDVRISVPDGVYFSVWHGAAFGCHKIGELLS